MLLDQDQSDRFHRDGFVLGPAVLGPVELLELHAELDRVMAAQRRRAPLSNSSWDSEHPVWTMFNIWESSAAFRLLLNLSGLAETVARLIGGREIRLWHDQVLYKPAGVGGLSQWHQDWPYWPTMSEPGALTAWIALDDAHAGNGCMSMVPGSHLWGNAIAFLQSISDFSSMPASWNGHETPVRLCPARAGQVHFHHSMTWHGSGVNRSPGPRRGIALHFMNDRVRKMPGAQHPCTAFCEAGDGETIRGARFPLVWQDGRTLQFDPAPATATSR